MYKGGQVGCGEGKKRGVWGGGLVERAGRHGGYTRIPFGTKDDVTDAPQARDGISWRDAADNLICLMIIRWVWEAMRG